MESRSVYERIWSIRNYRKTKRHKKVKNYDFEVCRPDDWFVGLKRYCNSRQNCSKNKLVGENAVA